MTHYPLTKLALVLALMITGESHAVEQQALYTQSLAATCANCHGTDGRAEPGMISLAGSNKDDLVKKMQDYKTGRVQATVMHQLAKGYSDAQIVAIAGYFAAQKK